MDHCSPGGERQRKPDAAYRRKQVCYAQDPRLIGSTIINSNFAMPSQAARQKAKATIIFQTIEDSSALQDILTASTTDDQKNSLSPNFLSHFPMPFLIASKPLLNSLTS